MSGDNENNIPESKAHDRAVETATLASAARYLARSAGSGGAGDACGKQFSASFGALCAWGEENRLIRTQQDFSFFSRPPDACGHEHEVWFDEDSRRWFKATYPNKFGLAWGRAGTATPAEYISRLRLQNAFFGDDIALVALLNTDARLRILTSQPHVAGGPASAAEIQQWFFDLQFIRVTHEHSIAWYRERENLLVADAHEGNVIKTADRHLIPIDLNIVQPEGAVRDWAIATCRQGRSPDNG